MPIDYSNLATIATGTVAIGTLLWTIYERRRSGAGTLRREIDEDNSIRRRQLEEQRAELQLLIVESEKKYKEEMLKLREKNAEDISKLHSELASLKATILEKEKHIISLTTILQGRNPEMVEILREIKEHLIDNRKYSVDMHSQNKKILDHQTSLLERGQTRSDSIDKASIDEQGKQMRVPNKQ